MSSTIANKGRILLSRHIKEEEMIPKLFDNNNMPRSQSSRLRITEDMRKKVAIKKNSNAVTSTQRGEELETKKENIKLRRELQKYQEAFEEVLNLTEKYGGELSRSLNDLLKDFNLDSRVRKSIEEDSETTCSENQSFLQTSKTGDSFLDHLIQNPSKLSFYINQLLTELNQQEDSVNKLETQLETAELQVEQLKISNQSMINKLLKDKNYTHKHRIIRKCYSRKDTVEEYDLLRDLIFKFTEKIQNAPAIDNELIESLVDSANLKLFTERHNIDLLNAIVSSFKRRFP